VAYKPSLNTMIARYAGLFVPRCVKTYMIEQLPVCVDDICQSRQTVGAHAPTFHNSNCSWRIIICCTVTGRGAQQSPEEIRVSSSSRWFCVDAILRSSAILNLGIGCGLVSGLFRAATLPLALMGFPPFKAPILTSRFSRMPLGAG
jgi:hypothetical protein